MCDHTQEHLSRHSRTGVSVSQGSYGTGLPRAAMGNSLHVGRENGYPGGFCQHECQAFPSFLLNWDGMQREVF